VKRLVLLVAVAAALLLPGALATARGPAHTAQVTPAPTATPTETPSPEPTPVVEAPPVDDPPVDDVPPEEEEPPVFEEPPLPRYPRVKGRRGLCPPVKRGEHCGPGNGRRTSGGGDKVSHDGWPAITGVFFIVQRRGGKHRFTGTNLNDEILGYDGHDRLAGGKGKDVLWGDWHAVPHNPASQRDTLLGGPGRDFIYTSHGRNAVKGGAGNDRVYAHWGRGVIDCGPGEDWVGVNNYDFHYKLRGCEHRVQW
jgi:hypothetical protein